jgi:pimeloyl-ACP methyl ester carboxylesterase
VSEIQASDGVPIHFERYGESGPLILFSCAYTTTWANWLPQVEPLTKAGYRVALWDFRGHGRSGAPDEASAYSITQVVDDLGRVLDEVAPGERVVLAGLSFGGLASLHFAIRSPERVRALLLAGSGPGFKNPKAAADWKARSERTADFLESRGMAAFVAGKAAATCIGRQPELPAAKTAAEAIVAQDPRGVAQFGRYVAGLAPSVIDDLANIDCPSLVVVGSEDAAYLQAAEVMAAKLPAAEHAMLEGAGHILNIEAADAFNDIVLGYLARIGVAPAAGA